MRLSSGLQRDGFIIVMSWLLQKQNTPGTRGQDFHLMIGLSASINDTETETNIGRGLSTEYIAKWFTRRRQLFCVIGNWEEEGRPLNERIRVRKQAQHNALVALCCILSILCCFVTELLAKNVATRCSGLC